MTFGGMYKMLWALGFVGHAALLLVLLLKGRARRFPVLTCMMVYKTVETIVLFVLSKVGSDQAYFDWYWIFAGGDYLFQLALIWEIAREVLRPTGTWVRDARKSFLLWSAVGLVTVAGVSLALSPPGVTGLDLAEMRGTIFTSLLTCVVFLAMMASANRLGLRWRSDVMALGQGLTAWALVAIVGDLARFASGWNREFEGFNYARMIMWVTALGFWIYAFWVPEKVRAPLSSEMQDYLVALHRRVEYDLGRVTSLEKPS